MAEDSALRQLGRFVARLYWPGALDRKDPPIESDPEERAVGPYPAETAKLIKRREAGEIAREEFRIAIREIRARPPEGLNHDSALGYVAILATFLGLAVASVVALVWAILTVIGLASRFLGL